MWIRAMAWELYERDRAHHADHHAVAFDSTSAPATLWVGNDGGISISTDAFAADRVGYMPKAAGDSGPQTTPVPANVVTWRKRSHGLCVTRVIEKVLGTASSCRCPTR